MNIGTGSRLEKIDIAIVGAGPHALTLATHLLQKRKEMRGKFVVFDPSGRWLSQWSQQFAAQEIPHLRSPAVHHPDPDPYSLRRFAQNRSEELFPPYDLPGTKLFEEFCQETIARWQLEDAVIPAKVTEIEPLSGARGFRLEKEGDSPVIARRVVMATGGGRPFVPDWVQQIETDYPGDRLCHSQSVDLRQLQLRGDRVLIIGGGLTSGHLATGAISRGAKVTLMIKRRLQEKLFDAEPGWLGPKYLKGFTAESDWGRRWQLIQQARDGGSMTPEVGTRLRRESRNGNLSIQEECQVVRAVWNQGEWQVVCNDGTSYTCDRIWLATGTKVDVTTEPLFDKLLIAHPVPIVKGLPVLDEHLRWPGCELFIMGGLAALQVGPVARNLSGARMASDRIQPALTKASVRKSFAALRYA